MSSQYEVEFSSRPYGFRIVGDDCNNNAIVKAILNPTLAKKLYVGSWIVQIGAVVVETWVFSKIIQVLRDAELPVMIKFRQSLLISGTDAQLLAHEFTPSLLIQVSDTGKEPSQQKQGKPFVAYNLLVTDNNGLLKWQLWKRYRQFEQLHQNLKRIVPDLQAQLPPKQHFGRFRPGFIKERRLQLERYLNSVKQHPGIVNCNQFRNFLIPRLFSHQQMHKNVQAFTFSNPSEMKPLLLECRDRLEALCDDIELKNVTSREDILSAVRYLLSLVSDISDRTKDAIDGTTLSRNFITGLPNNNAFLKCCDEIFHGKYLLRSSTSTNHNNNNNANTNANTTANTNTNTESNNLIDVDVHDNNNNNNNNENVNNTHAMIDDIMTVIEEHEEGNIISILNNNSNSNTGDSNDGNVKVNFINDNEREDPMSMEWGLLLLTVDDFGAILKEVQDKEGQYGAPSKSSDISGDLLRHIAQTMYSCIINEHQKVFHLDSDQFSIITPIDALDDLQRLAAVILTRIRQSPCLIEYDFNDDIEVTVNININNIMKQNKNNNKNNKNKNQNNNKNSSFARQNDHLSTINKSKNFKIVWDPDQSNVAVWVTISIGLSALKSEKLLALKSDSSTGKKELVLDSSPADWIQRADLSLQRAMQRGKKNCIGPLLECAEGVLELKKDVTHQWFDAARKGDHARILEMCKTGFNIDSISISYDSETKLTALMTACIYDHSEVVRTLLRYHANINSLDEYGRTALMHAAQNSSVYACKVLLEDKKALDIDLQDKTLKSALMYAVLTSNVEIVSQLLSFGGADVNLQNQQGLTVLMLTFVQQCSHKIMTQIANKILDYAPDLTLQDEYQQTALICAAKQNQYNICQRMLSMQVGAQIDSQENKGLTALMWASFLGHISVVDVLLQFKAQIAVQSLHFSTALHFACETGHRAIVSKLLNAKYSKSGDATDIVDADGDTCLHCAVFYNHLKVVQLLCKWKLKRYNNNGSNVSKGVLLQFISTRNKSGSNAIDIATQKKYTELVEFLNSFF